MIGVLYEIQFVHLLFLESPHYPVFSIIFLLYYYYWIDLFILFSSFYVSLYNYCIYLFSIVIIILFNGKPVPPM